MRSTPAVCQYGTIGAQGLGIRLDLTAASMRCPRPGFPGKRLADTARPNPDSDLAAEQLSIVVGKLTREGCLLPVESGLPCGWVCHAVGSAMQGAQAMRKF